MFMLSFRGVDIGVVIPVTVKDKSVSSEGTNRLMPLKCGVCGSHERHGSFVCDRCVPEARRLYKAFLEKKRD